MRRAILTGWLWLTVLGGVSASAEADPFAALQVSPYGEQVFDLATGITTLLEGGEVLDQESGVVLTGSLIRYQDEVFVEVAEALVQSEFGAIEAGEVYVDLQALLLQASGGVRFLGEELTLTADTLSIYLEPGVVKAEGGVSGEVPALTAAALLIDVETGGALLVGPYQYRDGPVTLHGQGEGDLLMLRWDTVDEALAFEAATEIDEALWTRLSRYLP